MSTAEEVLETVRALLASVKRLERLYPGRHFTLDGHLVGSIGEVLASELYGLDLLPASAERHDAVCPDGRQVQVKLTQTTRVSIYSEPDYLLVLALNEEGHVEEIYNGPGGPAWRSCGKPQKNGQRSLSIAVLRTLSENVPAADRVRRRITPWWLVQAK